MLKCSFHVDAPYADHLYVYPFYTARIVNREPVGWRWDGYGAGHKADQVRQYTYGPPPWFELPDWTLVGTEYSMYYPEGWEVIGNPNPSGQGFVGYMPFYAMLEQPLSYGADVKYGYCGMASVYNSPEEQVGSEIPSLDLTPMITRGYDPMFFSAYSGPVDVRGPNFTEFWSAREGWASTCYHDIVIFDENGVEIPQSQTWGTWRCNWNRGMIKHLNVSNVEDWYSQHGDRLSAYIQPLCNGKPVSESVCQEFFPGFGPNFTHSFEFLKHSQSGDIAISMECMRLSLDGFGMPDLGFQVGVRLKKADGTYVGLRGLKPYAKYDQAESNKLHSGTEPYNPWCYNE